MHKCLQKLCYVGPKLETMQVSLSSGMINGGWYVHMIEYYPAEKMNKRRLHLKAWLNLTDKSSERSQTQKGTYDFHF